jgi:hypothetical protein
MWLKQYMDDDFLNQAWPPLKAKRLPLAALASVAAAG